MIRKWLLSLLLLLAALPSLAQVSIEWHGLFPNENRKGKALPYAAIDSIDATKQVQQQLKRWQEKGYLLAQCDSIRYANKTKRFDVYFTIGKAFNWTKIQISNKDRSWLQGVNAALPIAENARIRPKAFSNFKEQVLTYAENHGYPFAQIGLDSIYIGDGTLSAHLDFHTGPFIVLDSIIQREAVQVQYPFLYRYLGLQPNKAYDESAIKAVNTNLKNLSFVKVAQPAEVLFLDGHSLLYVSLLPKQANRFNFIIGFVPANNTGIGARSTVQWTGDGEFHLENINKSANEFNTTFKLNPDQTRFLHVDYTHPYPFKLRFGLKGSLDINKFDTSSLNVLTQAGVMQWYKGNNTIQWYYKSFRTTLLNVDTVAILAAHKLPAQIDGRTQSIGAEMKWRTTDNLIAPHKGWEARLNLSSGLRKVFYNNQIIALDYRYDSLNSFRAMYDTLNKNQWMAALQCQAAAYIPFSQHVVLKLGVRASKRWGVQAFDNEVERIGGFKTLRGFNELTFPLTGYSIQTAELRYILEGNSFVYLFMDQAYTELYTYTQHVTQHPLGFGAGLAFETKAGIFQVSYAYGKTDQTPVQWRSAKIHFGYLVQF